MNTENDLSEYRKELDAIDEQLVSLFCRRMNLCGKVGEWKKEHGKPILDRGREREKLNEVATLAGEEYASYTRCLYRSMMGYSRAYQNELIGGESPIGAEIAAAKANTPELFPSEAKVCCQGVEGAYSGLACEKMFASPSILFVPTFADVFEAVDRGEADYGVLPIENSTAGSVKVNYDLLIRYNCRIVRSTRLQICHCLLASPGASIENVKVIYSHEQAISQCAGFLAGLSGVEVRPCLNTAVAAQMASECKDGTVAAISSRSCAEQYGLKVLRETIQDAGANRTRFVCISKKAEIYPGAHRTTLMLVLKHRPGALFAVLERINEFGVNLVKLESRPLPERDFEFSFYFDLDIAAASPSLPRLIRALEPEVEELKYLGSYTEVV